MSEECEKSDSGTYSGTYVPTGNAQDTSNSTVFAMNEVQRRVESSKLSQSSLQEVIVNYYSQPVC